MSASQREIPPERWQQISEIFANALEFEPAEREQFLARACVDDEDLLQTVSALLKSNAEASDFIETPALKLFSEEARNIVNESAASLPFTATERFSIRGLIGSGNTGAVYYAWDKEMKRFVALKDISRAHALTRESFCDNFSHYRQIAHSGLVTLLELFQSEEQTFFTMSLVNGVNCLTYLRQRNGKVACAIMKKLAEAIAALHDGGQLHGAIRAGNVQVDKSGAVITTDFGLFAQPSLQFQGAPCWSNNHLIYLAPEEAHQLKRSRAGDWYSFGVILYQMLTGQSPFAGSPWEIMLVKRRFAPPAPSALVNGAPAQVDALCQKLLQPEPQARPEQAEIIAALAAAGAQSHYL